MQSFCFCVFFQIIDAINSNPNIGQPKWPTTVDECNEIASGWAKLSGPSQARGLFTTVIGMVDGILIRTVSPSRRETKRRDDFRSGHKKQIGLNCQALCDSSLRFLFISVKAPGMTNDIVIAMLFLVTPHPCDFVSLLLSVKTPGKTNDLKAYRMSKLSELVENLPEGYWCGGDNAYCNSEHLLVPFPGQNLPQRMDSFNFFLSQLRVRIENAFALLVSRWGILWRPLRVRLKSQPKLIKCLCKLHNFCIDEKEPRPAASGPRGTAPPTAMVTVETEFNTKVMEMRSEWLPEYRFQRTVEGPCLRNNLADMIMEMNYVFRT